MRQSNHEIGPVLVLSGSRRIIDKARALGLSVVHIQDPTMTKPELAQLCLRSAQVDLVDIDRLVDTATRLDLEFGFSGVVTVHEPASAGAEAIARALGLRAPGEGVAALLRDKARTREAMDRDPELAVPWSRVTCADDIRRVGKEAGYPVIVKPVDGSASLGVTKVDSADDAERAWELALRAMRNDHHYHEVLPLSGFLVEPFFHGAEYSVESFSHDSVHEVCAVVRKVVNEAFVEIGHVVPADLPPGPAADLAGLVVRFLDLVGLTDGPAHTEAVVSADDTVRILESHARPAGDGIPLLVGLVTGRDLESELIAYFTGLPRPEPAAPPAPAAAKAYLTAAEPGRVVSVPDPGPALGCTEVRSAEIWVAPGGQVRPATASWERIGELIATGTSADAAWTTARLAAGELAVTVEPDSADRQGDTA